MYNSKKANYRQRKKFVPVVRKSPLRHLECSSQQSPFRTPQNIKKKIRQRVHKVSTGKAALPQNKEFACHVVGKMVQRKLRSPSTKGTMSKILDRHHTQVEKPINPAIQKIYRRIIKYRTNRDNVRLSQAVNDLTSNASIRETAKQLNISYTSLYRLLVLRQFSKRRVTERDKAKVIEFYSSNRMSLQLPYKKYAKYHYLRSTLSVAYDEYVREQQALGDTVLSKTAVYRCLKGRFRTRKKIPFKDCQCVTCVNPGCLISSLIVAGVKGISRSNTENVMNSLCPIEQKSSVSDPSRKLDFKEEKVVLTDHNRDCIFRKCKGCGAVQLQAAIIKSNPNIDWQKTVWWHQWEKVEVENAENDENTEKSDTSQKKKKKQFDKILYEGTLAQLLSLFTKAIHSLSVHIFNFRWQAFQYDECKKQLKYGDILMVMDFAQNHSHHRQDEVQSGLWSRPHTTLHPIIIYYCCPEPSCTDLVKEELMIISDDLKHDGFAVNTFIEKALEHLAEREVVVNRIVMFSDNCGPQYKSCKVFETLSKANIPVMRNYFGASHGKGEHDGCIGRLSMIIDAVVRSGTFELGNFRELARYCQVYLTVGDHKRGLCCHYHRHYYEVSNIIRVNNPDIRTVAGTLGFHSVRNTGTHGVIEVRASSCFCDPCFLGHPGECRNKALVLAFEWASLYKVTSGKGPTSMTMTNSVWKSMSSKYVYDGRIKSTKRKLTLKRSAKDASRIIREVSILDGDRDSDENQSVESEFDFDSDFDSDFEDNIPLVHLLDDKTGAGMSSPISS